MIKQSKCIIVYLIGTENGLTNVSKQYGSSFRAIKHALTRNEYFGKFEEIINEIFKFYNNNVLKRKTNLRKTVSDLKQNTYELNYINHTRWITSEFQSVSNLKKMWKVLATSL